MLAALAAVAACGTSDSGPHLDVIGTWQVTRVSCNGVTITSSYLPSGATLRSRSTRPC